MINKRAGVKLKPRRRGDITMAEELSLLRKAGARLGLLSGKARFTKKHY